MFRHLKCIVKEEHSMFDAFVFALCFIYFAIFIQFLLTFKHNFSSEGKKNKNTCNKSTLCSLFPQTPFEKVEHNVYTGILWAYKDRVDTDLFKYYKKQLSEKCLIMLLI